LIALLAAALVAAASPAPSEPTAACPRSALRIVQEAMLTIPEGMHPTNPRVRVLADLGSDGRVRSVVTVESSGDFALDAAAAKAVEHYRFAPPAFGCVTTSSTAALSFNVPPEATTARQSPAPRVSLAPCTGPFVRPMGIPPPSQREAPGTATVEVALDSAASVTGVRLVHSSGNRKTDDAATVAARSGGFRFEPIPGCAQSPTTYLLEITFH
jgi:TonB family protein